MKELSLHITDLCNFRCSFCVWGETLVRGGERIPWGDLEGFLTAHRDQGFERVNLHGGEPTLRRDLFRLLRLVRDLGYPSVSIQTNGWSLASLGFVERLVEAGASVFVISIHGHTPEIQDALSGMPGSLERLLRGMKNVRSLKQGIRTNTVVTRVNYAYLPDIACLAVRNGASHVNISSLMPSGRALPIDDSLLPTYREIARYVRSAVEEAEKRGAAAGLEGFPCCVVPGLEDRCLFRDLVRGDQVKCLVRGMVWNNHDELVEDRCKTKQAACRRCIHAPRCPGVYTPYVLARGWSEFHPVEHSLEGVREEMSHASR